LKRGREALAANHLDEAMQLAQLAKTAPSANWGLFDFDTPDKLAGDVNRARTKRDQDESVRVLQEGRRLLEQNDLDGAQKAALHAQTLHGPYSVWDLGDRPNKLIEDVEAARKKGRKTVVPAPTAVARNTLETKPASRNTGEPNRDEAYRQVTALVGA